MEKFVRIKKNVSEPKLNGKGWGDCSVGRSICAANMRNLVQIPSTHTKRWEFLHMRLTPKLGGEGDGSKQVFWPGNFQFSETENDRGENAMSAPVHMHVHTPILICTYNTSAYIHTYKLQYIQHPCENLANYCRHVKLFSAPP